MIEVFARYLRGLGRPATTARNYVSEVARFAEWMRPRALSAAAPQHLKRYLEERKHKGAAQATINRSFYALKRFYSFLVEELRVMETNPAALLSPQKHEPAPPEAMPRRDIRRVLDSIEDRPRDRALFLLLLSGGLRLSEAVELNTDDVRFDRSGLTVRVNGYNGKPERLAFPSRQCARALASYMKERRGGSGPLFLSRSGKRLAARTVQANFSRYFRRAGAEGSIRWLRHTFAIRRLKAGAGLADLQYLLGHKTMQSIQRYAILNGSDVRQVAIKTEEEY